MWFFFRLIIEAYNWLLKCQTVWIGNEAQIYKNNRLIEILLQHSDCVFFINLYFWTWVFYRIHVSGWRILLFFGYFKEQDKSSRYTHKNVKFLIFNVIKLMNIEYDRDNRTENRKKNPSISLEKFSHKKVN